MNNYKTLSNFKTDWAIKVIPYDIKYRKAYDITNFDFIFLTIVNEKSGSIDKNEFASLLGFNIVSNHRLKVYGDLAEEEIFDFYLEKVLDFKLLEIKDNRVLITEDGVSSLLSKLKYKYYSARVGLFQNFTATENEISLFSFKNSYGIVNPVNAQYNISSLNACEDSLTKKKIDFQLFENSIYRGEVLENKLSDNVESYKEFEINASLNLCDQGLLNLHFEHHHDNCIDIDTMLNESLNEGLKKNLIRRGEFYHYLNENQPINANIILNYLDLWDWKKLATNNNVTWEESEIFGLFSENGERSVWEIISSNVELTNISSVISQYEDFWSWTILTERYDNAFIKKHIHDFPWDFEVISHKDKKFVLELLSDTGLEKELWDWQHLSSRLPNDYIIKTIEELPWDFFKITSSRFEIFKDVFNKAFSQDTQEVFKKPWDWKYISLEIKLQVLFKHLRLFASFIDWEITLQRFFTDLGITKTCLSSGNFKVLIQQFLPENFVIKNQSYIWSASLITFFDNLGLIQWDTHSYIDGFDQNKTVKWDIDTFVSFHNNINTPVGFSTVSAQIQDSELLVRYPEFDWDWDAISQNDNIINSEFILDNLQGKYLFTKNLAWDMIFQKCPLSFWNGNLAGIKAFVHSEKNNDFYKLLTTEQDFPNILANLDIDWDWKFLSEEMDIVKIIETLHNPIVKVKWEGSILTRRFTKTQVFEYLENCKYLWDWNYLISDVFEYNKDLLLEDGGLERVAKCLIDFDKEKKTEIWNVLTGIYPIGTLFKYIEETAGDSLYRWNWTSISLNPNLKTDLVTLNTLRSQLNWTELSRNKAIDKKFDSGEWDRFSLYLENTEKYLKFFLDEWNWDILSRNESLNWNRIILEKFQNQWNWDYLSEFGKFLTKGNKDNQNYLNKLFKKYPKLNFELISKRTDIEISSEIILANEGLKWNWEELSNNPAVELSGELLLQLQNKNWDWNVLTSRKDISISNDMLVQLKTKDWDWKKLSSTPELIFDHDFITEFIDRPWDWVAISTHSSFIPSQNLLPKIKKFDLDWNHISKHQDLQINREVLLNFGNKLDWYSITRNKNLPINEIDLIEDFKVKWDWSYLSAASEFPIKDSTLSLFDEFLDWELLSANTNIQFSKESLIKFEKYWNWNLLAKNIKVKDLLGNFAEKKISASSKLKFLSQMDSQYSTWKNAVYHFTHIDNALEIIKSRKIQSRKKATILADAAGNVIHLRDDAHSYARFYFRPHTPTQFYNEFLGKSILDGYKNRNGEWISWYEKSRSLGFPKCPIPIFFRFSLKEIVYDESTESCISNGNMQTRSTKFGPIGKMSNTFGYEDLYYTPEDYATKEDYRKYREFSQQEFLVKDELDFSSYQNYEIICATELDKNLLENMLGTEYKNIFSKIIVDSNYYNFQNPRIDIRLADYRLSVQSDFKGNGSFYLTTKSAIQPAQILEGNIEKITPTSIIFKSNLTIENLEDDFTIKFIDESSREWTIYRNRINSKV